MSRSLESEQYLIACALLDEMKAAELLEIPEDWFSHNAHKLMIRAISELAENNLSIDMFSVGDYLRSSGNLDLTGGMEYLVELSESVPSIDYFNSYKNALFNTYKLRMIEQIKINVDMQLKHNYKPEQIIEGMQESLIELLTDHHKGGFKKVGDFLGKVIDEMEWREAHPGQLLGQKTGLGTIDHELDGLQDGKVYVIAGRPGSGKTAFAMAMLSGLTETQNPWFAFSLEMTGKSLAQRMLVTRSGVANYKFRSGKISETDLGKIGNGMGAVQDRTLFVDDTPNLSIAQIRSRLKAQQVRHGKIGGILVDHIGLVRKDARKSDTEGMNIIADSLLGLAKEFNCPLVELCQLNRAVESRSGNKPMLSDLKQSGKIEENADVAILLYRADYYDKDEPPITEAIIAKSRDGQTGTLYFQHDMSLGKYEAINDYVPPKKEQKTKF